MVPLTTYSLATLPSKNITEAAGLFAYGRMLGTSIGVSLLSTLVSRLTQINWSQIGEHINIFNNNLRLWLSQQHLSIHNPQALGELKATLAAQASMMAFLDAYRLIAILLICFLPLVWLLKHVDLKEPGSMGAH